MDVNKHNYTIAWNMLTKQFHSHWCHFFEIKSVNLIKSNKT